MSNLCDRSISEKVEQETGQKKGEREKEEEEEQEGFLLAFVHDSISTGRTRTPTSFSSCVHVSDNDGCDRDKVTEKTDR